MLLRLFIAAMLSPAGKGLISWLLFVMFNCVFITFPCGILGQVWYLIVSIPDLCHLSYFRWDKNNLTGTASGCQTVRSRSALSNLFAKFISRR